MGSAISFLRVSPSCCSAVPVFTQTRLGSFRQKNVKEAGEDVSHAKELHDNFVKRVWLLMPKPKPVLTPDEAEKRYRIGCKKVANELREHNTRQKKEMIRIKPKWASVNALPTPCREAAMIQDNTIFPDMPLLVAYPPKLKDPDEPDDWKPMPQKRWKYTNNFRD